MHAPPRGPLTRAHFTYTPGATGGLLPAAPERAIACGLLQGKPSVMPTVQTGSVLERTVLKEGEIYLVADRTGDVKALNLEGHGLYYRDTRHLSLFELEIPGTQLTLLSAAGELNFMSNLQFANDRLLGADGQVLAEPRTISIRRNRFLHGSLH